MARHAGNSSDVPGANRADRDVMIEILAGLSVPDRDAILRYYRDRQAEDQIELDLDLSAGNLLRLRRSVRSAFFERRRRW